MNLYEIKYLRDDKTDPIKSYHVAEYFVADNIERVFNEASKMSKNTGDEILGVIRHVPILGTLT